MPKKKEPVGPRPCWLSLESVREAGVSCAALSPAPVGCAVGRGRKELVGAFCLLSIWRRTRRPWRALDRQYSQRQGISRGIGGIVGPRHSTAHACPP